MSLVDTGVRAPTRPPAVTVLAWPAEADRAALLKAVGQARLLLVAADADPPEERDDVTDWVRLPVSHRDVMARVDALGRRGRPAPPWVDDDDVLRLGHRWVALSPIEADIVRTLIDLGPRVVRRDEIAARVWLGGAPAGRPVDARLGRLRARIEPLGLRIHTIRERGLLLAVAPESGSAEPRPGFAPVVFVD